MEYLDRKDKKIYRHDICHIYENEEVKLSNRTGEKAIYEVLAAHETPILIDPLPPEEGEPFSIPPNNLEVTKSIIGEILALSEDADIQDILDQAKVRQALQCPKKTRKKRETKAKDNLTDVIILE